MWAEDTLASFLGKHSSLWVYGQKTVSEPLSEVGMEYRCQDYFCMVNHVNKDDAYVNFLLVIGSDGRGGTGRFPRRKEKEIIQYCTVRFESWNYYHWKSLITRHLF